MPQSYTEGQRLLGSDGQIYIVRGGVPTPEGGSTDVSRIVAPSPVRVAKEAQDRQRQDAADARASRDQTLQEEKDRRAKLEWDATHNSDGSKKPDPADANNPNTAAVRSAALQKYNAARQLDGQIATMREKFKAGPGSTSGIWGIEDYFGGPANNAFDTAANAARGNVGTSLGFTGGQLNTENEAKRNIGPYIPQSSDWDATAQDKMAQLEALRDTAVRDSIQVLGGIPDANGNVAPLPTGVDPLEYAKKMWGAAGGTNQPAAAVPTIRPPGGGGPYGGPGPGPDMSASGSAGENVIGTGMNAVPNPEGQAIYKEYLGLWSAGASDDVIRKWSQKVYGGTNPDVEAAILARRQGKKMNFVPGEGLLTKNVPSTDGLAGQIADSSASSFGTYAANVGNSFVPGLPQFLAGRVGGGNPDLTDIRFDSMNAQHPTAAALGQLTGGAAGAAGFEGLAARGLSAIPSVYRGLQGAERAAAIAPWAARGGDVAYGAVGGATSNPDDPLMGAALGGVLGGAGGVLGRGVARGAGNAVRGITNEAVRGLNARGIPMTAGQVLGQSGRIGGAIKGIEDRLSGIPIVGDMVNARRREGIEGFNRAAFQEGGAPIGFTPNAIREEGLGTFGDASSQSYGNALNGVQVTPDAQFATDAATTLARGRGLPRTGPEFGNVVDNEIAPIFNATTTGTIDGPSIQDLLQTTRGTNFGNDAMGSRANDALAELGGNVTDLVGRQSPQTIPRLQAANEGYRNLNILGDAVGRGINTDGLFSPAQLGTSVKSNTTKFGGKLAAVSEDRPFFDLQRYGQNVLPSKVPDSGTAGRILLSALLPAALGGGVGEGADLLSGGEGGGLTKGLAVGGLLAAGGSRLGQRLMQAALLDRPDALVRIGNQIQRRQALGGILGAPLLLEAQR